MLCGDLNGKEIQKEGIYIYNWLTFQKLTNTVKQLYSNKNLKKKSWTQWGTNLLAYTGVHSPGSGPAQGLWGSFLLPVPIFHPSSLGSFMSVSSSCSLPSAFPAWMWKTGGLCSNSDGDSFCPWLKRLERSSFYLIGPLPCPITLESCPLAGLSLIQPQPPQSLTTWLKLQLLISLKPLKPGFVILEAMCILRFKMKC